MKRVAWLSLAAALCAAGPAGARDLPAFTRVRLKCSGLVTGIRTADFDGDGRRDLFLVSGRKFLLFRQRADGFPAWADAVRTAPAGTVLADVWVPPKGRPKVLCIGRRGVRALSWAGDGFAAKTTRLLKVTTAWRAPKDAPVLVRPVVRDLTGDGRSDLLVPLPGGYAIYDLPPSGVPVLHVRIRAELGTRVALLEQSRGRALYTESFHPPVTAGDADGDGRTDLVVHERARLAIYRRDAAGRWPSEPTRTIDKSTAPREKKRAFRMPLPVTVADITGDGVLDFVQAVPGDGALLIYDGRAGGRARTDLATPDAVIRTDGYALGALPRDLDGDGRLDLLVGTIDRVGVMGALQVFVTKSITVHSLLFYNRDSAAAGERFARLSSLMAKGSPNPLTMLDRLRMPNMSPAGNPVATSSGTTLRESRFVPPSRSSKPTTSAEDSHAPVARGARAASAIRTRYVCFQINITSASVRKTSYSPSARLRPSTSYFVGSSGPSRSSPTLARIGEPRRRSGGDATCRAIQARPGHRHAGGRSSGPRSVPKLGRAKRAGFQGVGGHPSKVISGQLDCRTLRWMNVQLQLLVSIVAGWVHRGQQEVIEYLQEENRVLREQLGDKRLRFTDVQRRRLAERAHKIGATRTPRDPHAGDPGHVAPLVPTAHHEQVRRQQGPKGRSSEDRGRDPAADPADGPRESRLGLHADSRRSAESRS